MMRLLTGVTISVLLVIVLMIEHVANPPITASTVALPLPVVATSYASPPPPTSLSASAQHAQATDRTSGLSGRRNVPRDRPSHPQRRSLELSSPA